MLPGAFTAPDRAVAGPRTEGLAWLRRFLDRAPVEQQAWLRLRALWSAAWLANWSGETATARAYATEGLALAEARQDEALLPRFLFLSAAPALQDGAWWRHRKLPSTRWRWPAGSG